MTIRHDSLESVSMMAPPSDLSTETCRATIGKRILGFIYMFVRPTYRGGSRSFPGVQGVRPISPRGQTYFRPRGLQGSSKGSDLFSSYFGWSEFIPLLLWAPQLLANSRIECRPALEAPRLTAHHRREPIDECATTKEPSVVRLPEPLFARHLDPCADWVAKLL